MNEPLLTEQAVRDLYKMHLGREIESQEVLASQLRGHRTVESLRNSILNSQEYLSKNPKTDIWNFLPEIFSRPAGRVDFDAAPGQLWKLFRRIATEWASLGEREAHWSVVTEEKFRRESFAAYEEEFYCSGYHAASFIDLFAKRNQATVPRDHVLELGCGTGRVTVALSEMFTSVTAVDISSGHLQICREALESRKKTNVELCQLTSPADVTDLPQCSLLLSTIVLQHNPPPLMAFLLDTLLGKVRPGGAALFQIPTHTPGYEFDLDKYLGTKMPKDFEMHCLPMHKVFALLHRHGFVPLEVIMDTWTGMPGSHTFFATKPLTPAMKNGA
jgi:SAM-dependent methyltransferase